MPGHSSACELLEQRRLLAAFVVTSTADSGAGTLRNAVMSANTQHDELNTITFNIGSGAKSITLQSPMTSLIDDQLTIDATTQPGYAGKPIIALVAGVGGIGCLSLSGGSSVIKGLAFQNFETAITISSTQNTVQNCYIGTDLTGELDNGGSIGILLNGPATQNIIGGTTAAARNVISGNTTNIKINGASAIGNVIQGNYIGTNAAGTKQVQKLVSGTGIEIANSDVNAIGGSGKGAGNLISGNESFGIYINNSAHCVIRGNRIGSDLTGTKALGNGTAIEDVGNYNTIGGRTAGARNLISGSTSGVGVEISGTGNVVQGNLVGTDITAARALGNSFHGILINGNTNTIGGTLAHAGNVIAFNGTGGSGGGVFVSTGAENAIEQNLIFGNRKKAITITGVATSIDITKAGCGASSTVSATAHTLASRDYRVEYFAAPALNATGSADASKYLGSTDIGVDGTGITLFTWTALGSVPSGWFVSATVIDRSGNTSELGSAFKMPFASLFAHKLLIHGTTGNDAMGLTLKSGKLRAALGTQLLSFRNSDVTEIEIGLDDGNDVLGIGTGVGTVSAYGGNGDDKLVGGDAGDRLDGENGVDTIFGGGGNDGINGNDGDDQLFGQAGDDTLFGLNGNDTLDGGAGLDAIDRDKRGHDTLLNVERYYNDG